MNKRKQKQISRILAAKRAEKCGQINAELQETVEYLEGRVHLLRAKLSINGINLKAYVLEQVINIKHQIVTERFGNVLLGLASGMIGGIIGMFMWVLCIL
ncbi:hypothetical protein MZA99_03710 [Haemophilus influenzae]|uniref:hypothetical protein n=1 Tax=Haemophilus influenzae TaxID=727 RepID=UPI000E577CD5|nr:hypothetical protein [Haemophilus influenzae]MCK9129696.1 hypothetical protein [Haemophilus influenzae]MCK9129957.1 hypothetical protein [Haemophilus influenzae]MCK9137443.1 hypothetical protein [Haemophilus influenzae]MCK9141989.1 hypothetical protein [Haemophilus influenzae]